MRSFRNMNNLFYVLFIIAFSSSVLFSQNNKKPVDRTLHHEVKNNDFVPSDKNQQFSPAYNYSMIGITTVQVNVNSSGQNILNDAANEPSLAINPVNPNKMAIGWRQFNSISSDFRQAGFAYTIDKGANWDFPGVIQSGTFRSDPVLVSDAQGNFFYNSLTNTPDYYCKVFKSTNGGASWDGGVDAKGGDKQWMTIDRTGLASDGNLYAIWNQTFSTCYPGLFTRSTNRGASFGACTGITDEPYWGILAVNKSGDVYVAGTDGLNFKVAKSTNAKDPNVATPTWTSTTVNLDGDITVNIPPNPGGLGGQTHIAIDTSGGIYNNYVYVLCSAERRSNTDPSDIMFARSTNGGVSFSAPIRINDDIGTTAYQWFGTMSVAPNGRIDVVWLDTRDHPGSSNQSALYYAYSLNGGAFWSENMRLSGYFNSLIGWPQQNKMGDYFHMISDNEGAHLAWAATFNGEQDVYYSFISQGVIVPVEMISFSAASGTNGVTLKWATATELNNRGFEIQKSIDGKSWVTVGFQQGSGTSQQRHDYSFTDKFSSNAAKLYYRLKQIDMNGSFVFSEIAEAQSAADYFLAQNYPNPFNPSTVIRYRVPEAGLVTLKVYDVLGKEVSSPVNEVKQAGSYDVQFNGNNLTSGIYFYKLTANGFTTTKRMLMVK